RDRNVTGVQTCALPISQWHAAGVSMGGNALLKYLGEQGTKADWLHGCAAISAPLDLVACGEQISNSFSGRYLYNPYFLRSMKARSEERRVGKERKYRWC